MPVRIWPGLLLCAVTALPATAATLSGRAGLDGRARAGRWMPVEIVVESSGAVDGTLSVEWGGSRVERPVTVAAGTRRTLTFTLRTGDPRSLVRVHLAGTEAAPVDLSIPVIVDSSGSPIVACVNGAADPACTSVLPPERTPRTWREYDVADEVRVGTERPLTGEERDALALWAGRRQTEMHFGLPVDPSRLASGPPSRRAFPWLALALIPPLAGGLAGRRRRRTRALVYLAALGAATAAAAGTGRMPPRLAVRHATTLHAFAGTDATIVESRFVVDAETEGRTELTLSVPGGVLDHPGTMRIPSRLTADGLAAIPIDGRMGAAYPFEAEFTGPLSPVYVARTGGLVSIENRSSQTLSACRLPSAFSAPAPVELPPGARVTATHPAGDGDTVTCTVSAMPLPLTGPAVRVPDAPGTLMLHLDTVLP